MDGIVPIHVVQRHDILWNVYTYTEDTWYVEPYSEGPKEFLKSKNRDYVYHIIDKLYMNLPSQKRNLQGMINCLRSDMSIETLNEILMECVTQEELSAAVYVYDHILEHSQRTDGTMDIIEQLHRKDILDNSTVMSPFVQGTKLSAKRRIHKICKARQNSTILSTVKEKVDFEKLGRVLLQNKCKVETMKRYTFVKWLTCLDDINISNREAKILTTSLKRRKIISEVNNVIIVL